MTMKLKGRNALVTGASRGIGRACAVELAREGANVAINFRSHPEEAEQVAAEVRAAGSKALLVPADVSDQIAVDQMVAKTAAELGSLDLFVSNAAYSDRELMMVNLDLLDTFDARQFPPRQLNFVLYNPTAEARFATITIPSAPGAKVHWSRDGKAIAETLIVPGRAILRMVADF